MTGSQRQTGTAENSDTDASSEDETPPHPGPDQTDDELAELNYEQARDELIKVVQQLETGGAPLTESLALWERGEKLAAICQQWLDGAKQRVEAARRESASASSDKPGDDPA